MKFGETFILTSLKKMLYFDEWTRGYGSSNNSFVTFNWCYKISSFWPFTWEFYNLSWIIWPLYKISAHLFLSCASLHHQKGRTRHHRSQPGPNILWNFFRKNLSRNRTKHLRYRGPSKSPRKRFTYKFKSASAVIHQNYKVSAFSLWKFRDILNFPKVT